MPYILSPEQKVVVNALLCKEASSTKYFDVLCAIQSICKACISAIGKDKNVFLHIPDERNRKILKSIFETIGLQDLTIDLSEKNPIPEVDLIKLRTTLKKQRNTDAIINYVLSQKRVSNLERQIVSFYKALDEKVLSDIPFRDFMANSIYKKNKIDSFYSGHTNANEVLDYSATEYHHLKKEINNASKIYHRQYELYDHLSLFDEDLWNDITDASILKIKEQLNSFKSESSLLVKDFMEAINKLQDETSKKTSETFVLLENKFDFHEEACIAYEINKSTKPDKKEGLLSIFNNKGKHRSNKVYIDAFDELTGIIQNISQEWYNEVDAPSAEMISYDFIITFINTNREKASRFKKNIDKYLKASIQRINKINTVSQDVISLDHRLEQLILKMNESELFDLDLEHNILSFMKQVELSKQIFNYIEKCNILVNSSSSYLEWKSFYNSTGNIFRLIFDNLKMIPKKEWIEHFEQWYEHQIFQNILGQKTISVKSLKDYFSQANSSNQYEVSSLIANLQPRRVSSAGLLKSTSKELHNILFKKKQMPSESWNNTALLNRPFMQSFFPIHISDAMSYSDQYDLVISFSNLEINEHKKIHCFSPIERKDIEHMSENKVNFLYLNDYHYNRPLSQLSSTDKLKASKKLAKYILSLNQNIKIYQLKNANIISLLPNYDDSYLEYELDKVNVKVIDTNGVMYDRLTESILFTERKPFLIIKDGLINSELHEHTLWQLKMIELFEEVGYEIISLNTTDQVNDNKELFNKILQKINGTSANLVEKKNQVSDELESISDKV